MKCVPTASHYKIVVPWKFYHDTHDNQYRYGRVADTGPLDV